MHTIKYANSDNRIVGCNLVYIIENLQLLLILHRVAKLTFIIQLRRNISKLLITIFGAYVKIPGIYNILQSFNTESAEFCL